MKSDILISFVIPAYNAEQTIEKAVLSIVRKKYDNIEVIVVENGSEDCTWKKLNVLAKQYDTLRIFQSEKGVSFARNKGISEAKGKWIAFLDADDYLLDSGLDTMILAAQEDKYDLVAYGHEAGKKMNRVTINDCWYKGQNYDDGRILMIENPTQYMQVWAKLFRKKVIDQNGLCFDTELRLSEDSDFTLRYLRYVKSICLKADVVYHYSLNENSTMRTKSGNKTKDYIYAMERTTDAVKDENERIKTAFNKYILMHLNILMVREVFCLYHNFLESIRICKRISNKQVFRDIIKNTKLKECTSARMIPIYFLKMKLYCFAGIVYRIRVYMNNRAEKRQ